MVFLSRAYSRHIRFEAWRKRNVSKRHRKLQISLIFRNRVQFFKLISCHCSPQRDSIVNFESYTRPYLLPLPSEKFAKYACKQFPSVPFYLSVVSRNYCAFSRVNGSALKQRPTIRSSSDCNSNSNILVRESTERERERERERTSVAQFLRATIFRKHLKYKHACQIVFHEHTLRNS